MFTGIVDGVFEVTHVNRQEGLIHYAVELSAGLLQGLKVGASIAVDGVCQTVVGFQDTHVAFDAIQETLSVTTLQNLREGQWVNIERALRVGDELGGHFLSGHVYGKVQIVRVDVLDNNHVVSFQCPPEWMKYLFKKGFIALDGISLTLVTVDPTGFFSVSFIPETLRSTIFKYKKKSDWVNIELDSQTQVIVDTVEQMLKSRLELYLNAIVVK